MRRILIALLVLCPSIAFAVSQHMDQKVDKIPGGARVRVVVKSASQQQQQVRVGLLRPAFVNQNNGTHQGRGVMDAENERQGGTHAAPYNQGKELILNIDYARHGLQAGETVRLVTTWQYGGQQWHVWGQSGGDFVLP